MHLAVSEIESNDNITHPSEKGDSELRGSTDIAAITTK